MQRSHLAFLASGVSLALVIAAACSDQGDRPGTVNQNIEGGVVPRGDSGPEPPDGGEGGLGEAGEGGLVLSCTNKIKDGFETDTDCGGNQCGPCLDGKECTNDLDCAGGSCKAKKCTTPACNNALLDGTETDVDCGGKTCAQCTFGKHCKEDKDCVFQTCDAPSKLCSCPERMAVVPLSGALGGAFCIDDTEVTAGDYDRFVKSNQPITTQVGVCKVTNTTFVPSASWPPPQPFSISYPIPVRNVDWCDAVAYCTWMSKQLCGKIGGGPNAIADRNNKDRSAWYNACSAQGNFAFPYGNTYQGCTCTDDVNCLVDDGDGGMKHHTPSKPSPVCEFADTGNFAGLPIHLRSCQGGATFLYGMSGNVAEWEDSCTGAVETDACLLRGGSFRSRLNPDVMCTAERQAARMERSDDIGFRCCVY